jgi:hypothetical protein
MQQTAVIGGNGLSLESLLPGQVLADDFIVRVNNFFFEPKLFLGNRVDLAFMGGDPRVAPFMFETLYRKGTDYDLRQWSSHNPKLHKAGHRFATQFLPMQYSDDTLRRQVETLIIKYQHHPMTGTYGAFMAHGLGLRNIVLVGIDFYSGASRYLFEPGPHYRALMGSDLNKRAVDRNLHNPDLDLKLFELLAKQEDVRLTQASHSPALAQLLDAAPIRRGRSVVPTLRQAPTDWETFAGFYPIHVLRTLRRVRRLMKKT